VSQAVRDVLDVRADDPQLVTNRLGSGSDYTVFLNFLGVPIADLSFTGPYGVYHSVYDNHVWMKKFGDPGFERHVRMTRVWGAIALRLANADVIPLDYRATAARIREFIDETAEAAPAGDRQMLRPLSAAADRFGRAADETGERIETLLASGVPNRAAASALDRALIATERAFLDPAGIPNRPWYRHLLYAPKPTYAAEVLPGVTEALERNDRALIEAQVAALAAALNRAASTLAPR
jgi:N-acetylated-alpha-linked acidic dipeptidase